MDGKSNSTAFWRFKVICSSTRSWDTVLYRRAIKNKEWDILLWYGVDLWKKYLLYQGVHICPFRVPYKIWRLPDYRLPITNYPVRLNVRVGGGGGPMRGLEMIMWPQSQWQASKKKNAPDGANRQTDKQTDGQGNSMTEVAQWGRFSENENTNQI